MDYDDDGILDFISGSYDPGDVYLFRGLGGGKYAAVEVLEDRAGVPIVHHPKQLVAYGEDPESIQDRVASFGSWAAPVDWDADGDLDLLIGSFSGRLYRRMNIGTRSEPVYDEESIEVAAGGSPFKVRGHANPVVADWNEDGLWDLVVGASDGGVVWVENSGTAKAPVFGPMKVLVDAKNDDKFFNQYLQPGEEAGPGARAQICVTDYDHDGRLDLVLGDHSSITDLRLLDGHEEAGFDALLAKEKAARARRAEAYGDDEAMDVIGAELTKLAGRKKSYFAVDAEARTSSHVWLYLRRPTGATGSNEPSAER